MKRLFLPILALIALGTTTQAQPEFSKLKTDVTSKSLLDSTIQYNWNDDTHKIDTTKMINTYYSDGSMKVNEQSTLKNKEWTKNYRNEYTYNASNRQVNFTNYSNWNNSTWTSERSYEYIFNSNGKIIQKIVEESPTFKTKDVSTFDSNGNNTEYSTFSYNNSTSTWEKSSTYLSVYYLNTNSKIDSILSGYSNTPEEKLTDKTVYTYYKNGVLNKTTSFNTKNTLEGKQETTYDTLGQKIEESLNNSSDPSNNYDNKYTYDKNQKLTKMIYYLGQTSTNSPWIDKNEIDYTYNENGEISEEYYSKYSLLENTLSDSIKKAYTYNSDGKCTKESYYTWDTSLKNWKDSLVQTEYFYSTHQITGVETIAENESQLSVYPNPASQWFSVKTDGNATVEIYNSSGILVWEQNIVGREPISVSKLVKGLYIVRIKTEQTVYSEPLIVQ